ncbi:MAG: hypothetical protein ACJ76D_09220 [Solirubrobacterales bacterium]
MTSQHFRTPALSRGLVAGAALLACAAAPLSSASAASSTSFGLIRSAGLPGTCATKAKATAKIVSLGFAEKLTISVSGLAPNTATDLFVIQVPQKPFGIAWYLGDLQADSTGKVTKSFVSRLNVETFAVAVGSVVAPPTHSVDAATNPAFAPVHTYHLGVWFNSNADAAKNGCPAASPLTPFNGDHTAGIQVLNTGRFPDTQGPLSKVD